MLPPMVAPAAFSALSADAPGTPATGSGFLSGLSSLSYLAPLFGPLVGVVIAVMLIKRIWIMPVGEHKEAMAALTARMEAAAAAAEESRVETKAISDSRIHKLHHDNDSLQVMNGELTDTIIKQVVPAVTRVAAPLSELAEIKRAQSRKRGARDGD